MIFKYGMKYRPAGPGSQPRDLYSIEEDPNGKYYNIITYRRELTPEEVANYELENIQTANTRETIR